MESAVLMPVVGQAEVLPQMVPTMREMQQLVDLLQKFQAFLPATDQRSLTTVAAVIEKYLANCKEEIDERTREYRQRYFVLLCEDMGDRVVSDLSPLDLKEWMTKHSGRMKSDWTKAGVKAGIQRAFNWAVEMRIIRENPFKGLKLHGLRKAHGRDMKQEEFQALLRHSDVYFRRFLITLKFTGARPCELAKLTWNNVDFDRGLAVLEKHKTGKKTGKPRTIVLIPQIVKLLKIMRRDHHGTAAAELRKILENAPDRTCRQREVTRRMRQLGFGDRAVYSAREAIGARFRRQGGWSSKGYTVYELPLDVAQARLPNEDFVFLSSKFRPWTRTAWGQKFDRLRKRIGLPLDCKLYGTRHYFTTIAIKRGVNLKAIATLLGHTTTSMVERIYSHIDGDYLFLQKAAQAASALTGTPAPMPSPTDAKAWTEMMAARYPRIAPKPEKKWKPRRKDGALQECEKVACEAYRFAIKECPVLRTDVQVYEWLLARPEFASQLPPSARTFERYMNRARHHFEGAGKRKLRRRGKGLGALQHAPPVLSECYLNTWEAYQLALKTDPSLASRDEAYAWLKGREEHAGKLPATLGAFRYYLSVASRHFAK